ncbi:hypothetical protein BDR07DRAFT_1373803 [Suillus spraguei]|nr:hypothetical protein BDR07DRAFT_1373803 [Suillus spraguei]
MTTSLRSCMPAVDNWYRSPVPLGRTDADVMSELVLLVDPIVTILGAGTASTRREATCAMVFETVIEGLPPEEVVEKHKAVTVEFYYRSDVVYIKADRAVISTSPTSVGFNDSPAATGESHNITVDRSYYAGIDGYVSVYMFLFARSTPRCHIKESSVH